MPAISEKQRKFFGLVLAIKRGTATSASPMAKKAAGSISESDAKDFASKRKGLIKSSLGK